MAIVIARAQYQLVPSFGGTAEDLDRHNQLRRLEPRLTHGTRNPALETGMAADLC